MGRGESDKGEVRGRKGGVDAAGLRWRRGSQFGREGGVGWWHALNEEEGRGMNREREVGMVVGSGGREVRREVREWWWEEKRGWCRVGVGTESCEMEGGVVEEGGGSRGRVAEVMRRVGGGEVLRERRKAWAAWARARWWKKKVVRVEASVVKGGKSSGGGGGGAGEVLVEKCGGRGRGAVRGGAVRWKSRTPRWLVAGDASGEVVECLLQVCSQGELYSVGRCNITVVNVYDS